MKLATIATIAIFVVAVATTAGCFKTAEFACTSNTDCTRSGIQGTCETVGYCSFPDPGCDGGRRYSDYSGAYTGTCVGGGSGSDAGIPVPVMIGGTVSGLVGTGLVLRDNGADDLAITTNGAFTFPTPVFTGFPYAVVVGSQPSNPSQTCTVTSGVGLGGTTDITNVGVTCATAAFTVGGTVLSLVGTGLVLTNNGGNAKSITASGAFVFSAPVASGGAFAVAIQTQPSGQTCSVSGATGTVGVGNVSSVVVNCAAGTYTIGGTVSGLTGTVVLRNNGGDDRTLNANGSFAFATPLMTGATYSATVLTQPAYPPNSQTCTVTMGAGTVATANIMSVVVSCSINSFTIGGMVSGLTGTLVLRNNGGNDRTISANAPYTFTTPIASGMIYAVTVFSNPANQTCSITNGGGTVTGANITNANAACVTMGVDPGIACATANCNAASQGCCLDPPHSCVAKTATTCGSSIINCDDTADCVNWV